MIQRAAFLNCLSRLNCLTGLRYLPFARTFRPLELFERFFSAHMTLIVLCGGVEWKAEHFQDRSEL